MADVGGIFVQFGANVNDFVRGINKASKSFQDTGKKFSDISKKIRDRTSADFNLLGQNISVSLDEAFGAVALFSINAASTLAETQSKFDAVFGENSDTVRDFAETTANALGRGQGDIEGFLATAQSILKPLGLADEQAAEFSKTITRLAVDLGSFNNVSDERAFDAIRAGILGETEALKGLGVVLNQTVVNQELLNKGLDPKNATEAEKAIARYNLILQRTQDQQGDAVRTSEGFANQLKNLQARVGDVAETIGGILLPIATRFVDIAAGILQRIAALDKEFLEFALAVAGVAAALPALVAGIGLLTTAFGALLSPVTLTIAALVAGAALIITNWERVVNFFNSSQIAGDFLDNFRDIFNRLVTIVSLGVNLIIEGFTFLFNQASGVSVQGLNLIQGLFKTGFEGIIILLDAFINLFSGSWAGFFASLNSLAINNWLKPLEIIVQGAEDLLRKLGLEDVDFSGTRQAINDTITSLDNWQKELLGVSESETVVFDATGKLVTGLTLITEGFKGATDASFEYKQANAELNKEIQKLNEGISNIDAIVADFLGDEVQEDAEKVVENLEPLPKELTDIQQAALGAAGAVGTALGNAFKGAEDSGKQLLKTLIGLGLQIAALAIGGPVAGAGASLLTGLINSSFATGGGVKKSFATGGGLATGPTIQFAESGQSEAFIPMNRIPEFTGGRQMEVTVTGDIQGEDIRLSNSRAGSNFNRRAGGR